MTVETTRRSFVAKMLAAGAVASGLHGCGRASLFPRAAGRPWNELSGLDGALLTEEAARAPMAVDLGGHEYLLPGAVLKPGSEQDVARVVQFANAHRLNVVMRGRGHAQYGRVLAAGGVVIDSRTLNSVTFTGGTTVDVQPGASWGDVTQVTLAHGLTPPAMGDSMGISVGGILSAGGISNSSHLYGGVVDNVDELEVVTGAGERITCSPERNRELFELTLAGMGQCGLIVRARLRLVAAPRWVVRRNLDYDDLSTFLADHRRLASEAKLEHLGAYVVAREGGGWRFRINIGAFCAAPESVDWAELEAGLRFVSHDDPQSVSFADYLRREAARDTALEARLRNTPSRLLYVTMFLPGSESDRFIARMLTTPTDTEGVSRFSLYSLPTRNFTRPLFVLPAEPLALCIFLFREIPRGDEARYARLVAGVRDLVSRMHAASGTAYPPHAPFYHAADWKRHYGAARWSRLTAARNAFDPRGVLTPGMSA